MESWAISSRYLARITAEIRLELGNFVRLLAEVPARWSAKEHRFPGENEYLSEWMDARIVTTAGLSAVDNSGSRHPRQSRAQTHSYYLARR